MPRCVNCSLSIVHPLRSREVGEATDVMVRIVRSWVTPATVSVEDVLCQECYTILERASLNLSSGSAVVRAYGHRQVCLVCGSSILRAKTHRVSIDNPEGNFIMSCMIPIQQSQDSSGANEIKVFCPKCNTEVSHTAKGIQQDQTKILVAKVYHYFEQEYEGLKKMYGDLDLTPLSKFRQRTALATGVSETTILKILKEEEGRNADKRRKRPQKQRAALKRRRQTDSPSEEDSPDDNDEEIEQPSYVDEVETLVVKIEPPENTNEEPEIFIPKEVMLEPADGVISKEQSDPIFVDVKIEPRDDAVDTTSETLAHNEPAATKRTGNKISRKTDDTSTRVMETPDKEKNKNLNKDSAAYLRQKEKSYARKIKFLEKMTEEQKEIKRAKDREYHRKKKAEKKVKKITDMTEREKQKQRKEWKKASRKYREKKKRQHTPSGESSAPVASSSAPLTETLNESCLPEEREIKMEIEIHEEGFS